MPKLEILNRLGSDNQCEHSVVGINLVLSGSPLYAAAKYGNGIRPGTDSTGRTPYAQATNILSVSNLSTKGCFSIWCVPNNISGFSSFDRIFQFDSTTLTLRTSSTALRLEGTSISHAIVNAWANGLPKHVAIDFDTAGIKDDPDNAKVRLWEDGAYSSFSTTFSGWAGNSIRLGVINTSSFGDGFNFKGMLDNFNAFDRPCVKHNYRLSERGGLYLPASIL